MKTKICGITNLADALDAIAAGADFLGFNFYLLSPRYISPAECANLVASLESYRPAVGMVGVFVNASPALMEEMMERCNLDIAQLSGDEPPETIARIGKRSFKALRPANEQALQALVAAYPADVNPPAYLLDAHAPGQYGGSGRNVDWSLAAGLAARYQILLAGGLTPDNVSAAIQQVHPWGVDVASGVERSPGRKDAHKMAEFIRIAKAFS